MKKTLNWVFDYPNLQIYQFKEGFKFSLDSILLAEYVKIRKNEEKIIDLCTGNGIIPILLHYKYQKKVIGVEIQPEIAQLAQESVQINKMNDSISILECNVLDLKQRFAKESFQVVVSNPPYFKYHNEQYVNDNLIKGIARHELKISLKELFQVASYLLKERGRFYLVHIPERIEEIILYANENNLAVKTLQFISSKEGEKPILVLASFMKNGKVGCKVAPQISIGNLDTYQNLF